MKAVQSNGKAKQRRASEPHRKAREMRRNEPFCTADGLWKFDMEKRKDGMRMKKYIGTKMVEAEKAFKIGDVIYSNENNEIDAYMLAEGEVAYMGYKVRYPDGYESFSPKAVFEKAYLPLEENKKLKTDAPSISQKMVDDFISHYETKTLGNKTTVVRAVLVNGFEIVESSSCVSEENYDEGLGYEICVKKIKEKVWYLLGFLLQTAVHGIDWRAVAVDFVPEVFAEKARDLEAEYEEQVEQERKMLDEYARGKIERTEEKPLEIYFALNKNRILSSHVKGEEADIIHILTHEFARVVGDMFHLESDFMKNILFELITGEFFRSLKENLKIK